MNSLNLNASAHITSSLRQTSAVGQTQAEFTDIVTVSAPGVPPGAPLTLRLAFWVSGSTNLNSGSKILCTSRIAAVGPLEQIWEKTSANDGTPLANDPNGTVEFEIPVVEGDPSQSKVLVAFIAESVCGLTGSDIFGSYNSQATCSLSAQFLHATLVDASGKVLPIWTIESESMFDYGEGDATAVLSNPPLSMSFPPGAPGTVRLSWQTNELESYTLESSPDCLTWTGESTVTGNDLTAAVNLPRPGGRHFYRLVSKFIPDTLAP
jgi:hypothetical protein